MFDNFRLLGMYQDYDRFGTHTWTALDGATRTRRRNELPAPFAVVDFPACRAQAMTMSPVESFMQRISVRIGNTTYLHRETLAHLQANLDPAHFLRIHRSTLVNIARIREVHPLFHGNAEVMLHDDTRLNLSRRFRQQAQQALGKT